jgi:uncharacterized protein YrrD
MSDCDDNDVFDEVNDVCFNPTGNFVVGFIFMAIISVIIAIYITSGKKIN